MTEHEAAGEALPPERVPPGVPTANRADQTMASAALVLGIAAFLMGWLPIIGIAIGAIAVLVGILAARRQQGKGRWLTGLILGSIATVFSVIISVSFIGYLAAQPPVATDPASSAVEPAHSETPAPSPTPAKPEPAADIREHWPLAQEVRVPQFVGMNLEDARKEADRLGLNLRTTDERDNRQIWFAPNWTVVWQEDVPGSDERDGKWIELLVLKHDEVDNEALTATLAEDFHHDEKMFTGRITGFALNEDGFPAVLVDSALVTLDLVQPLTPSCEGDEYSAAQKKLEEQLPVGQRVLVVMSDKYELNGFIHVLSETSNDPAVAPPADSVNEILVSTGWWVPDSMAGGVGVTGYGPETLAFEAYEPLSYPAESPRVVYAPRIADAGNEATAAYTGTVGECLRAAETERDADVASWEKFQRESEQRIAEAELRLRENRYTYCRDGDGDGVCNEG